MQQSSAAKFPKVKECLRFPMPIRDSFEALDADIRQRLIRLEADVRLLGMTSEAASGATVTVLLTIAASKAFSLSDLTSEPHFLQAAVEASAWAAGRRQVAATASQTLMRLDMKALEDGNGGWLVRVTYPEGGGFEVHDFSTKAGALTWVMVNRRRLETEYSAAKKS